MCKINARNINRITRNYTRKSNGKALSIILVDLSVYVSLLLLVYYVDLLFVKAVLSVLLGVVVALLFIVGHDCCHESFMGNRKLNRLLGLIAFLPSWHNFELWKLGHNETHHRYTNLSTKDYVYTPLSVSEYASLSRMAKLRYRIYRTVPGHLPYYLLEIWWPKMLYPPTKSHVITDFRKKLSYSAPLVVLLLLLIFMVASRVLIVSDLVFMFVLPFLIFNWIMGFAIYQHHTDENIRWFRDELQWHYWESQVGSTVHIVFPRLLSKFLHNIMDHTAHHCNMDIPLYNLDKAQRALEEKMGGHIQIVRWNLRYYLRNIRHCKLYDYTAHRWLTYS